MGVHRGKTSGDPIFVLHRYELKGSPPQAPILGCIFKFSEGGALKKISDAKDTPPLRKYEKVREGGGYP